MEYQVLPPPPVLQPFVRSLWHVQGGTGGTAARYDLMAEHMAEVVFQYENPFQGTGGTAAVLHGPSLAPIQMQTAGRFGIVGAALYPDAVLPLFGLTNSEMIGRDVGLDLLDPRWPLFAEQIQAAGSPQQRLAGLASFLCSRVPDVLDSGRFPQAIRHLLAHPRWTLDQMADAACLSPRQFERRFRAAAGISPKLFQRIMRFHLALQLPARRFASLGALAAEAGYYDQSHLHLDFRTFGGQTPGAYYRQQEAHAETLAWAG